MSRNIDKMGGGKIAILDGGGGAGVLSQIFLHVTLNKKIFKKKTKGGMECQIVNKGYQVGVFLGKPNQVKGLL